MNTVTPDSSSAAPPPSDAKRSLLLHISHTSVAHYVSEALFLVRGLLLARLLGPAAYGTWSSMRLILTFGIYVHFGARSGMLQRAPRAAGAGHTALAHRYQCAAVGVNLLGAFAVSAILVTIVLIRDGQANHSDLWLAAAGLVLLQNGYIFYRTYLRSRREFVLASTLMVSFAAVSTVAGLLCAWCYGLPGFLAALGGSYILVVLALTTFGRSYPRPAFDRARAAELVGVGLPIMTAELLRMLLWNTDKLLLWWIAGSAALGIYAVQAHVTAAMMLFPAAISQVLLPHLASELGRTGSTSTARRYLEKGSALLAQLASLAVALVFLTIHLPIRWLLPDFSAAIAPGEVLVLATFFPIVGTASATVLVTVGEQRKLPGITLIAVLISGSVIAGVLLSGGGFVEVALGSSLGLAVRSVLALITADRATRLDAGRSLHLATWLVAPLVLLLATLSVAVELIPDTRESWQADITFTALRCGFVAAVLVPWVVWSTHRIGWPTRVST